MTLTLSQSLSPDHHLNPDYGPDPKVQRTEEARAKAEAKEAEAKAKAVLEKQSQARAAEQVFVGPCGTPETSPHIDQVPEEGHAAPPPRANLTLTLTSTHAEPPSQPNLNLAT